MTLKNVNPSILLLEYITEKEYVEINQLKDICYEYDHTNLKLELDYKLHMGEILRKEAKDRNLKPINPAGKTTSTVINKFNEFLYYIEGTLVAYLGISSFGKNIGEINGMTHPDLRRKGLFQKLLELALMECQSRHFTKILLLSDGKANSGIEFIQAAGGRYDFSEYRMELLRITPSLIMHPISLRIAEKSDRKELARQDAIYFNKLEDYEDDSLETASEPVFDSPNDITYLVELDGEVIGKIKVEFSASSAFIYGFGILPGYRGKGYGKATLQKTLQQIHEKGITQVELDVECKNNNALQLYKTCGFDEMSVMNYYQYLFSK